MVAVSVLRTSSDAWMANKKTKTKTKIEYWCLSQCLSYRYNAWMANKKTKTKIKHWCLTQLSSPYAWMAFLSCSRLTYNDITKDLWRNVMDRNGNLYRPCIDKCAIPLYSANCVIPLYGNEYSHSFEAEWITDLSDKSCLAHLPMKDIHQYMIMRLFIIFYFPCMTLCMIRFFCI